MAAELLNKGSMPLYMLVPSIAQDKLACMAQPSCAYNMVIHKPAASYHQLC